MAHTPRSVLALGLVLGGWHGVMGQCANNNTLNAAAATPPVCPGSIAVPCVLGGQYVLVNVVAGVSYTFSTCGGATWDTQITLYNNTGGPALGYNDDACGLQSSITWVATFTGQLRVLVDRYNCANGLTCATLTISCGAPPPPVNACCTANGTPGCENAACTAAICGADPFCCLFNWDALCAAAATANASGGGACAGVSNCPGAPPPTGNTCCTANGTPGCENAACQVAICAADPFCCATLWDALCASAAVANANSGGPCAGVSNCPGVAGGGGCAPGVGGSTINGSGSIQVQQNLSPSQLITDVFLGNCLSASNIQYNGSTGAIGSFTNGWRIGINSGIVLTSGSAPLAVGPNTIGSAGMDNFLPGHPLLTALAGIQTYDASWFQFTFTPQTSSVTFTYVFASEEYPEWVCASYNDVFGFFVSGPGYAPNTNIATIPGTSLPVAIDHVNNNGFCAPSYPVYFVNNAGGAHNQYDGFTVPFTACINTIPCQPYTIIIAVADAGDGVYDSAVFLEAESFSAGVDLEIVPSPDQNVQSNQNNCDDQGFFTFSIDEPLAQSVTLNYTVTQVGNVQLSPPLPLQVTFPAGTTTVVLPVNAVPGTAGVNPSSVTITLDTSQSPLLGCSCTSNFVTATLYMCDPNVLPVTWLGFDARPVNGGREVLCDWQTASEQHSERFVVERSADALHWQDIGEVPAAGNTAAPTAYAFTDPAPLAGLSYYRIREEATDGTTSHSEVRSVRVAAAGRLSIFPNPGSGSFQLDGLDGGSVSVLDITGRHVPFTLMAGGALTLHGAAAGSYTVEVRRPSVPEPERLRLVVR